MKIEQKGTPPYTVWTAETPSLNGGKSQPARFDTYLKMIIDLLFLTEKGEKAYDPEIHIKPIRVMDSKEEVILSMDKPEDVNYLKLIVQSGALGNEFEKIDQLLNQWQSINPSGK